MSDGGRGGGFRVDIDDLHTRTASLREVGAHLDHLDARVCDLAGQAPLLGTSLPARWFVQRLRAVAAGQDGYAGQFSATADRLSSYHQALSATVEDYRATEQHAVDLTNRIARTLDP